MILPLENGLPMLSLTSQAMIRLLEVTGMWAIRCAVMVVVLAWALGDGPASRLAAQNVGSVLTRPERSEYRETSSYEEVMAFVRRVVSDSPLLESATLGYTMEGRALPVVIASDLEEVGPEALRASERVRVYVQGNIHAGEVCGKEALQILLRELAAGWHREWLDSLVLLIAPIYNADGNERVRLTHRPYQHGPVGGMGQRANAQGLDLNRDQMKLESPEARSLVAFWRDYDPHVIVDLHTTNGTRHAYHLTYAPPLHPDTDAEIVALMRGELLPEVTEGMKAKYGLDTYYYGNLPWRGSDAERGWYTFSHLPRYLTNYAGLRNRLGLLSEAYAYATFADRIAATLRFVREVVGFAHRNASRVRGVVGEADAADIVGRELTLRAAYQRSPEPVEILMGEVVEERNPYTGRPMLRRIDARYPESLPEFGRFRPTESERAPAAYFVPSELGMVVNLLDDHGIAWSRLEAPLTTVVERFVIDSTTTAEREYQGHHQRTLYGAYEEIELTLPAGTAVVSLAQPLGRLAFGLLEPRADDGMVNWNVLDPVIEGARFYPITRQPASRGRAGAGGGGNR